MGWTTGVSRLSLKDWRVCYAEHNRDEQVLLHQELYGYALQYSRILAVIRHQLGREPKKDEVFIVMSRNRRLVRLFSFDRISFSLYEKRFAPEYQFMQALAYEVYMKNVTFGNLHKWVQDMGMSVSKNTLRNWLKKGKKHLDSLILLKDAIVNCDETWYKVRRFNKYTILDEELRKDNEFRSPYMMQALNYLDHFWDGLFL